MYRVEYYDAKGRMFCYASVNTETEAKGLFNVDFSGCSARIMRKETQVDRLIGGLKDGL